DGMRIRSDRERRRLFPERGGRYREGATEQVYRRLRVMAGSILDTGFHAIVDAAFLSIRQRREFLAWSKTRRTEAIILDFPDPGEEALVSRLRSRDPDDPSEATPEVVALQREQRDPLTEEEARHAVPIDDRTSPEEVARLIDRPSLP
ncbi:MAG: AAA family ATPase, partial [Nitrospinae bacterium]|nr:AAA family ATPase [Nitrospinota bacterium]